MTINLEKTAMRVTIELGHTEMTNEQLKDVGEGSIIELKEEAGAPVIMKVNGDPVALGEVVVVDEQFGLRVTDVLNEEQKNKLRHDILPYGEIIKKVSKLVVEEAPCECDPENCDNCN